MSPRWPWIRAATPHVDETVRPAGRANGLQWLARATMLGTLLLVLADVLQLEAGGQQIDRNRPLPADLTTLPQGPSGPVEPRPTRRPDDGSQVRPFSPGTRPTVGGGQPELPDDLGPLPRGNGEAMAFRLLEAGNGQAYILASGDFVHGTTEAFRRFDERQGQPQAIVLLDSPGGLVLEAIALGRYIRARGLSTLVYDDGLCASACPLAFAGGVERLASEAAWIGVHRAYVSEQGTGDLLTGLGQGQQLAALCMEYLAEMDVAAEAWVHALATPWSEIYFFTGEQLADYRLVTRTVD